MKRNTTHSILLATTILGMLVICLSYSTLAQAQYADIRIVKGSATIVRQDKEILLRAPEISPVEEGDVVQVGQKGLVQLKPKNQRQVQITLYSNSVFMVKQFTRNNIQGRLRAMYGRFRLKTLQSLSKGQRFAVKTPNYVAGIKGTEYVVEVASNGDSVLFVSKDQVQLQNDLSQAVVVNEGSIGGSTNGQLAKPRVASEEIKKVFDKDPTPTDSKDKSGDSFVESAKLKEAEPKDLEDPSLFFPDEDEDDAKKEKATSTTESVKDVIGSIVEEIDEFKTNIKVIQDPSNGVIVIPPGQSK